MSQKITPSLWFDSQAEEAANYYCSVFKDSKINHISHYNTENPSDKEIGSVLTVDFELNGQRFTALNGGPLFKFNEAISFVIDCENQEEIDYHWSKLSAVPQAEQCGWCKDQFGISWQIVPKNLGELVGASENAMKAMLSMKKLDIAALKAAA